MKVRALDMGTKYSGFAGNKRRLPGEVFEHEGPLGRWMEEVKTPGRKKASPKQKAE